MPFDTSEIAYYREQLGSSLRAIHGTSVSVGLKTAVYANFNACAAFHLGESFTAKNRPDLAARADAVRESADGRLDKFRHHLW